MELINKLEKLVLGWAKNIPHLPVAARKWLGINAWWIVLIGAICSGTALLFALSGLFSLLAFLSAASSVYYVAGLYTGLNVLSAVVGMVFIALFGVILAFAIKPLKDMQKKGWVLLFLALLVEALAVIVNAVLRFSAFGFISTIIFGAIGLAIGAYFLIEIHGQYAHPAKAVAKTPTEKS